MKPDAIKGLKHFDDEELVAEVHVPVAKDMYWSDPGKFSAHLFNSTGDEYVVRVYRVVDSVKLPKTRSK